MGNEELRLRRLRTLVRDERQALSVAISHTNMRIRKTEALLAELKSDRTSYKSRLKRFDRRLENLDEWTDEPVVLIRTSAGGYGLPVYHDSEEPCGYMWRRANFEAMLLAEAEDAGHRACSACGWKAKRRRIKAAA